MDILKHRANEWEKMIHYRKNLTLSKPDQLVSKLSPVEWARRKQATPRAVQKSQVEQNNQEEQCCCSKTTKRESGGMEQRPSDSKRLELPRLMGTWKSHGTAGKVFKQGKKVICGEMNLKIQARVTKSLQGFLLPQGVWLGISSVRIQVPMNEMISMSFSIGVSSKESGSFLKCQF